MSTSLCAQLLRHVAVQSVITAQIT